MCHVTHRVFSLNRALSKGFATAVYTLIGMAGYLMFGNDVYDEVCYVTLHPQLSDAKTANQISQNLLKVPGYDPVLNELALWMLVVTPLYAKISS
jgi:vesicular inhibitory amino acid transporter